ncbi:ATP-binding protein [Mycetocola sp. 2940]|uniref:ATP-binding protein n=1 Tax=Mycetocola sp. 2940 TaxID=3156452 RepID=UPI003397C2DB
MAGLIGDGHNRLLDQLKEQLRRVAAGEPAAARIIILRGGSGVGKSRIIREFYERLQQEEPEPKYWPPLDETVAFGGQGLLTARKVLAPTAETFRWPAKARPSFGWWAIDCARMPHGQAVDAAAQAMPMFKAHMPALAFAWGRASSLVDKLSAKSRDAEDRLRELINSGMTDEAGELIGKALGFTVPFLGLGIEWTNKAIRSGAEVIRNERDFRSDTDVGFHVAEVRNTTADNLFSAVSAFAHERLPAVVVIEDLHDMDASTGTFLSKVANAPASNPVLVVATAWPEHERTQSVLATGAGSEYAKWRAKAVTAAAVEVWDVPTLTASERVALVVEELPTISGRDLDLLAGHFRNPFALKVYLQLPGTRERIADNDGQLLLQPEDLLSYPPDVNRAMYDLMWSALPHDVRDAMMLAAGSRADSEASGVDVFIARIVAAAAGSADLLDSAGSATASSLETSLQDAASPYAWLIGASGGLQFKERDLAITALAKYNERYTLRNPRRERLRTATIRELTNWVNQRRAGGYFLEPEADVLVAANWLAEISDEITPTAAVLRIAKGRDGRRRRNDSSANDLLRLGDWSDALDEDHHEWVGVRALALLAKSTGFYFEDADDLATLAQLLPELVAAMGPAHPVTLETRLVLLPKWKFRSPPPSALMDLYSSLLTDQMQVFRRNDPQLLWVRHEYAQLLECSGRIVDALDQTEALDVPFDKISHVPRFLDQNTTKRADLLWKSGRRDDSTALYSQILGERKFTQWRALNSFCTNLVAAGETELAVQRFSEHVAWVEASNGTVSLTGRSEIAWFLSRLGKHDEAADQLSEGWEEDDRLRSDQDEKARLRRGPSDRSQVVTALRRVGRIEEAIAHGERAFRSYLEFNNVGGHRFRGALNQLTTMLAEAGRTDESILKYDLAIEHQIRLLGEDSREVAISKESRSRRRDAAVVKPTLKGSISEAEPSMF